MWNPTERMWGKPLLWRCTLFRRYWWRTLQLPTNSNRRFLWTGRQWMWHSGYLRRIRVYQYTWLLPLQLSIWIFWKVLQHEDTSLSGRSVSAILQLAEATAVSIDYCSMFMIVYIDMFTSPCEFCQLCLYSLQSRLQHVFQPWHHAYSVDCKCLSTWTASRDVIMWDDGDENVAMGGTGVPADMDDGAFIRVLFA